MNQERRQNFLPIFASEDSSASVSATISAVLPSDAFITRDSEVTGGAADEAAATAAATDEEDKATDDEIPTLVIVAGVATIDRDAWMLLEFLPMLRLIASARTADGACNSSSSDHAVQIRGNIMIGKVSCPLRSVLSEAEVTWLEAGGETMLNWR